MSKSTHEDELAAQWHDVMGLYHRVTCALDRTLMERHGVSVSDFEVLQQLHAADESGTTVRMSELESAVHLSQSALSRLISRLEGTGLVQRSMCHEDRRSMYIGITPEGSRRFAEARPTQRSTLRDLMTPAAGR
ncbi:MarR family winged helix-turn-helix transcriptional regulator [Streptomyces fuscigenes]|uniref:MarR family winged helix-turn-helix transcriptional regulator n=1 Tax=Streptomyces fuscigenes TaxID=1528880 RepID=UPI001F166478|nr:MarR family transcriptional regulator [Streptomyces fuscigenes]MCF3960350.1 MarR family transcriptional regulator [Streptomyces fuscigenes]